VWRARIILATAEGFGTAEIMRRAGVSKACVWRWQRRFMEAGVDGLLHDKTRKPGKAPVPEPVVVQLIARTLGPPPGETTPLDEPRDGCRDGAGGQHRAEDLARPWPRPASAADLQAQPRSRGLSTNCAMWLGFTSTRRRTAWCSRSTKRARSKPSTAPNPACR
jgi:hypothetical protein